MYNKFKDRGFVVLAIDVLEEAEIVQEYVEKEKIPFPVLLDSEAEVAKKYGVRATPAHFLIDGQGYMIGMKMGANDWASFESQSFIRSLVDENKKERG